MPTLVVDPAQYAHAAESMTSVAHSAHSAVSSLANELGASSGMAGSDNAGTAWADGYDQGARAALSAAASAVGAVGNIATRLHATGENHAHADASSVIGGGGDGSLGAAPTPPTMSAPSVPSSAGGNGGGPPGWSLVEGLVGYVWPNGHQDRLHAADAAWKAAAAQLQDAAGPTSTAASAVSAQQSPESAAAAQACTDTGSHLRELSSVFTELGSSCSEYAAHLDQAHHEIIHELEVLLAQTVAIEAVSAIAGFFTAGIGELAGQAVETARLTAAAAKIRGIIEALIAAARAVAASIGRVAGRAGELLSKLKPMEEGAVKQAARSTEKAAGDASHGSEHGPWDAVPSTDPLSIDYGDLNQLYKTEPNTAYFWSGRTSDGVGVGPQGNDVGIAAQLAHERGGVTLESVMRERGVLQPEWDADNPAVAQWWADHSAAYANNAHGEIHAVIGSSLRPGNIWENVELPRLMDNPAVSRITTIDPESLAAKVVFER